MIGVLAVTAVTAHEPTVNATTILTVKWAASVASNSPVMVATTALPEPWIRQCGPAEILAVSEEIMSAMFPARLRRGRLFKHPN